uniref:Sushi domain-containing protein n=1 Tax=Branchiostoma floridae TaxID=7739 RepID=C3YMP6_BRAFL|eukprot:XP_002602375.1 hypothetical protein BRAFLDRAFT_97998 [Branchiostoma floridae]
MVYPNVDCTSCVRYGIRLPVALTYKKRTICFCQCDFGCLRFRGKAVRECKIRPKRWRPARKLKCRCRPCAAPTPPLNYASSNCTGAGPFEKGTICTFVCPDGYYAYGPDRRHYCEDRKWRLIGGVEEGCKRDGGWSDWVDGECNCNDGTKTRTRTCNNPAPDGGLECTRADGTETAPEDRAETESGVACTCPP